jgi:hypothetical protein
VYLSILKRSGGISLQNNDIQGIANVDSVPIMRSGYPSTRIYTSPNTSTDFLFIILDRHG